MEFQSTVFEGRSNVVFDNLPLVRSDRGNSRKGYLCDIGGARRIPSLPTQIHDATVQFSSRLMRSRPLSAFQKISAVANTAYAVLIGILPSTERL